MMFLDIVKKFYPKCFAIELLSLKHVGCSVPLGICSEASHMDVALSIMGKVSIFNYFQRHF